MTTPTLHQNQPVLASGTPLEQARAAMVLLHGRGASAADILTLAAEFDAPGWAFLAPQAANSTWYPNRFTAPLAQNEPWFSSAIGVLDELLARIAAAGIPAERTVLLGFSQGACLALEYAARHPQRYGGVAALSGALIENGDQPRAYTGSLRDTPLFLGCSDVDPHIPAGRVERSAATLRDLGAAVTLRLYTGMGHSVNADEIAAVQTMIEMLDA